jgi:hypothetical protein
VGGEHSGLRSATTESETRYFPSSLAVLSNKDIVVDVHNAGMNNPLRRKLRRNAKKRHRREIGKALEKKGHHAEELRSERA